jgi:hypothetical protein
MANPWASYAVTASYGGMDLLVASCTRSFNWRISEQETPGTAAAETGQHGQKSKRDSVVALLTVPQVSQLEALGDKKAIQLWTHPLLSKFQGRITNLEAPITPDLLGYIRATFNVVESRDPNVTTGSVTTTTPNNAQNAANSIFADLTTDMDGLADIPGSDGASFTNSFDTLGNSFSGMDDTFGDVITGDAGWQDLAASLDTFTNAADTFVDLARNVEDDIGDLANQIQQAPGLITQIVRETVDDLAEVAQMPATLTIMDATDLPSILSDLSLSQDMLAQVMEENSIEDPFMIMPGKTITIPTAKS